MVESSELLKTYVRGIRHLSGAGSVTLFVPASLSGSSSPLLVHDGELAPVAELADVATASESLKGGRLDASALEQTSSGVFPPFLSSSTPSGALLPLPASFSPPSVSSQTGGAPGPSAPSRRLTDEASPETSASAWLGLRFATDQGQALQILTDMDLPDRLSEVDTRHQWWSWLFALGGALASHATRVAAVLRDPITGLPDRPEFQAALAEDLERARNQSQHLSLLLLNPDDFASINERLGRESGDRIVRELSNRLSGALRQSDTVARYGGVTFAATLIDTPLDVAKKVAESVRREISKASFLAGTIRLDLSIGIATFEPDDPDVEHALDIVYRADQALNAAKRRGGARSVMWEAGLKTEETGYFDRLSGFFTGNMAKDYRNMVLLRDAIDVMAVHPDFDELAAQMVEKLYATFKPDRVALFSVDADGTLQLVRGLTRRPPDRGAQPRVETVELSDDEEELLKTAMAERLPRRWSPDDKDRARFGVPLIVGEECLGCLFIDGQQSALNLESTDLVFLKALASQLAVALDRARLAEKQARQREREQRLLRAELNDLRQALQQAKLVYRSAEMDALVATARRVAPTDATVLISGPSGTGKELLARTIHELSPRRGKPMVLVDCGAISTTLIESELFGHEKGAYTGAHQRRSGRLAEAHTGTVFLDEIAELPLEVQSKLLRFVQEKQFTTVGGTRPRRVDVRILAASNRDLAAEVTAGRFREDLYYRLNVIFLKVPALKERPDDILHLARHFLELFAVQYHKNIHQLTPDAEEHLLAHSWSGNVRELQNRMMQAVILCEGEVISAAELGLPAEGEALLPVTAVPGRPAGREPTAAGASEQAGDAQASDIPTTPSTPLSYDDLMVQLRASLRRQIEAAVGGTDRMLAPLGRWLSDDVMIETDSATGGVARRGAALLDIPETTFRRRLQKAGDLKQAGLAPRMGTWSEVPPILARLVRCPDLDDRDLLAHVEQVLLAEIIARFPGDVKRGAALLGVTAPTFRRRVAALSAVSRPDAHRDPLTV